VSLAVGDVSKSILALAGIKDAWGFARGHTKTTVNYALATFDALQKTSEIRVTDEQQRRLKISSGPAMIHIAEQQVGSEGAEGSAPKEE
jgi:small subunit ribosomal protein S5